MKKLYVSPEIELDDFSIEEALCGNLYGKRNSGATPEFYGIGAGEGNPASPVPDVTVDPGRPRR